jgi:hypothetical protein
MTHKQSHLGFCKDHVGDAIDNGIFASAIGAYQPAFNDVSLSYNSLYVEDDAV